MFREQKAIFYQIFKSGSSKKFFWMSAIYKGEGTLLSHEITKWNSIWLILIILFHFLSIISKWKRVWWPSKWEVGCLQEACLHRVALLLLQEGNVKRHVHTKGRQVNTLDCHKIVTFLKTCHVMNNIQRLSDNLEVFLSGFLFWFFSINI